MFFPSHNMEVKPEEGNIANIFKWTIMNLVQNELNKM